ncbi:Arylsulfatase [Polystyrenella longa]|uniref:Arylsulfatase n=1 Tax=Polystyrenella longa TaxID=2528007 RepID=A0A518CKU8_9PLAN|nr:sulfatase [Polystyrenella longa]QDU79847.1 Arylsulfatase [Polystyrenella longa]
MQLINVRLYFCLLALVAVTHITGRVAFAADTNSPERPNIVLFIADDMAWNDAEPYGHPHIRTPNLSKLADGGVTFDNAFLTVSSCSPTRCSLITGRYPHSTGAPNLHEPLPADQHLFPEDLKKAGYFTGACGKWHLGPHARRGFSKIDPNLHAWQQFLEERPAESPFFFWIATTDPHRPYQPDTINQPHTADDAVVPPYLIDNEETRQDFAEYYDEIGRLDEEVGQIYATLEKQGLLENTLFVFISDNGRPFPRCKGTIYDTGIKTPLICHWPAKIKAGERSKALLSTVDLAPTFLKVAGVEQGETFQGEDFNDVLESPETSHREYVYAERNWHNFDFWGRGVRSMKFKYIHNNYPENYDTPPADAVRSPSFQALVSAHAKGTLEPQQKFAFVHPRAVEELYDIVNDPYEFHNLATDLAYQDELENMRTQLADWREQTQDPDTRTPIPNDFDATTGERTRPTPTSGK